MKTLLPLIQQRAEHVPALLHQFPLGTLGIQGLPMTCICPGSLTVSPFTAFPTHPQALKVQPGGFSLLKAPDPSWNPQQRWEFVYKKRAARQGWAAMDLFSWDSFPTRAFLAAQLPAGRGGCPGAGNFGSAMIPTPLVQNWSRCPAPSLGTRQWEAQPSTVQSCLLDQESWERGHEIPGSPAAWLCPECVLAGFEEAHLQKQRMRMNPGTALGAVSGQALAVPMSQRGP